VTEDRLPSFTNAAFKDDTNSDQDTIKQEIEFKENHGRPVFNFEETKYESRDNLLSQIQITSASQLESSSNEKTEVKSEYQQFD